MNGVQGTTEARQYVMAVAIGFGAALASGALYFLYFLLVSASDDERLLLVSILLMLSLPAVTGYAAGRILSRKVSRSHSLRKVVLACPGLYIMVVLLAVVAPIIDPYGFLAGSVPLLIIATVSFGFTAVGFYFSPHAQRVRDVRVCRACGYDLRGNITGLCPECGRQVPAEQKEILCEIAADDNLA